MGNGGKALEMASTREIGLPEESERLYDSEDDFDEDFQQIFLHPHTSVPPASKRYCQKEALVIKSVLLLLIISFLSLAGWIKSTETHGLRLLQANKCSANTEVYTRKEWRELSSQEQFSYLDAIKCMTKTPSKLDLNTSRLDDFTYSHINLVDQTHYVAVAMPWHRYFIWVWEQTLRKECGYKGFLPYWDWMIDPENMTISSIWDPIHGFGGNGSASDGCVVGGPLQDVLLNYTWDGYDPHCLTRNLTDTAAFYGGESDAVKDIVNTAKTYDEFRKRLERGPHKHIHLGINGEMLTSFSSNDPLFFLHHAQLDRVWSVWQSLQSAERQLEYGGKNYLGQEASVNDHVSVYGLRGDISVLDLLDVHHGPFCYSYSSVF